MANRRTTLKKFKLAGVAAAMIASSAELAALGLGTLEVQSNLDQPLNGVIELRVAPSDDVASITASIASREDFENLGIDYPEYLKDINLGVEDVNGATVLRVNSADVVIKEPFIHFLVKVNWSGGSFLREYTALIDPPVYAAETPRVLAEPKAVGTDQSYQSENFEDISIESLEDETIDESEVLDEALADAEPVIEEPLADESAEAVEDEPLIEDDFYEPEAVSDVSETSSSDSSTSATLPTDAKYGPVASGESLSVIAAELQRQFPDLSIYQIMKVLFDENPGAFIDSNINGLIRGSILNIGDLEAIRAVDIAESKRFYREQVNEWDPSALTTSTDSIKVGQDEYGAGDDPFTSDFGSSDTTESSSENFQVGSSADTDSFVSAATGDNREGEVIALREQISELQTSLASSSLEKQELTERISILEGQLDDMNRLMNLSVEDAEMAGVEQTLAQQNDAADESVDAGAELFDSTTDQALTGTTDDFAATDDTLTGSELVDDLLSDTGELTDSADTFVDDSLTSTSDGFIDPLLDSDVDSTVDGSTDGTGLESVIDSAVDDIAGVDSEVTDDAATPEPVVTPPAAKKSLMETVTSALFDGGLWKVLAGVGVLLVGGLVAVFLRRRRADEEFEISMLSIESNSQTVGDDTISASSHSSSMSASMTHSMHSDMTQQGDKETSFLTVYSDSDAVVQADEVDPIAEADVYIAYGRDEQAEEVLLDGVAAHPDRVDIKHKLLGLYHKNENAEGFERVAEELYSQRASLTPELWQEVCEMGKEVAPSNPLFELSSDDLVAAVEVEGKSELSDEEPINDSVSEISDAVAESTDDDDLEFATVDADAEPEAASVNEDSVSDDDSILAIEDSISIDISNEDEESIHLINLDEDRSEISELDEVKIDALDVDELDVGSLSADLADGDAVEIDLDNDLDFDGSGLDNVDGDEGDGSDQERSISEVAEVSDLEIDPDYDEARTQFELAKVFVDLGDEDGARKILTDIVANDDNANDVLTDAQALLESINS